MPQKDNILIQVNSFQSPGNGSGFLKFQQKFKNSDWLQTLYLLKKIEKFRDQKDYDNITIIDDANFSFKNLKHLIIAIKNIRFKNISLITTNSRLKSDLKWLEENTKELILLTDEQNKIKKLDLKALNTPNCLVKDKKEDKLQLNYKKTKLVSIKHKKDYLINYIQNNFTKTEKCINCEHEKRCHGFHKDDHHNLPPATLALDFQFGSCDFDCIFCARHDHGTRYKDLDSKRYIINIEKIKPYLINQVKNNQTVELCSRCAIEKNIKNLPEIIKVLKEIGYKEIKLWSNGIRLNNKTQVEKLINTGVTIFDLPIYGHTADLHDSIIQTPGSFEKLIQSITILKNYPVKTCLHLIPLQQNIEFLKQIVDYITSLKIDKLELLNYAPDGLINYQGTNVYEKCLVSFTDISNQFKNYKNDKLLIDINVYPLCVQSNIKKSFKQTSRPDNINKWYIVLHNDNINYKYIHNSPRPLISDKCRTCFLNNKCSGISQDYYNVFADQGISPV